MLYFLGTFLSILVFLASIEKKKKYSIPAMAVLLFSRLGRGFPDVIADTISYMVGLLSGLMLGDLVAMLSCVRVPFLHSHGAIGACSLFPQRPFFSFIAFRWISDSFLVFM